MSEMHPGWYSEPGNPSLERYWDGSQWTPQTRPREAFTPPALATSPARRKPPVKVLITAFVVLLAAGGFAVYWFVIRTPTMNVRGTMDLNGAPTDGNYSVSAPDSIGNQSCAGEGGYADIAEGAEVVVTDSGGKTLGIGHLEAGIYIDGTDACLFGWEVDGVASDQDFYGVEVTHRGIVRFSQAQMKGGPGLTLGN